MSANESRRRTDVGPGPVSSTRPKIDNTLPYPGRELDKDSTRLVEIQPAAHESEPVVCTLSEVTFGSRPKFEALSYMWGTESADEPITLNDVPLEVGRNLLDALRFLRRQVACGKAHQPFWIDAISINQSNVKERNRQLRIMDQIYFRASTVVVWLGSGYTKFQRGIRGDWRPRRAGRESRTPPRTATASSMRWFDTYEPTHTGTASGYYRRLEARRCSGSASGTSHLRGSS
jgi:hypothetical protein